MNKRIRSVVFASLMIVAGGIAQLAPATYAQTPTAQRFDGGQQRYVPPRLRLVQGAQSKKAQ